MSREPSTVSQDWIHLLYTYAETNKGIMEIRLVYKFWDTDFFIPVFWGKDESRAGSGDGAYPWQDWSSVAVDWKMIVIEMWSI